MKPPMKSSMYVIKWIGAVCLITACLCPVFATEINPYVDPAWLSTQSAASQLGACKISILQTYFWRDWMPIVSRPGPDGGSPLRAKVNLSFDNSRGGDNKFSFQVVIMDDKGQTHPVPFRVLPNYRVLPDAVIKSYRNLDEEAKRAVAAKYHVMWNGELKAGEIREVGLSTAEGPYLPVGSRIHAEITLTDQKGDSVKVRTPDERINRTD